jgi:DnaJ-class molecular chaperone
MRVTKAVGVGELPSRRKQMTKVPCPVCHGNGYVRDEEGTAGCDYCDVQGEVSLDDALEWKRMGHGLKAGFLMDLEEK